MNVLSRLEIHLGRFACRVLAVLYTGLIDREREGLTISRAVAQAFAEQGASVGLLARGRYGLEGAKRDVEVLLRGPWVAAGVTR